ncbi:peptidoglycan-binding domain-containing protein [Alicyclobacillus fodiniaquatilis]|jgi:peptidoglycan hydrolase-like protein with peptidoglycan-binding domain|uniref:Peptidoglycan-binding protein n=1 Tax=Alicyclobacillus fodiniaquatilis TaxID=1661150 RepID=A0ABW4JMQ8_9BACL
MPNEQKQLERQRRERKFRRWLASLSWTMPVVAFGGFFSIWHNISASIHSDAKSIQNKATTTAVETVKPTEKTVTTASALYKIGSTGSQVTTIQEQLYELGYFNHAFTEYYGPVTSQAVKSFQQAYHLTITGEIDRPTLNTLKQAVKTHKLRTLPTVSTKQTNTQTRQSSSSSASSSTRNQTPTRSSSQNKVTQSQPTVPPITSSSASQP